MVSDLLASGHPDARRYPFVLLNREYRFYLSRQRRHQHDMAVAFQQAYVGARSEKGWQGFKAFLHSLIR